MRSTFGAFTTAQLGMRASQYGLNVTGQNISNIHTNGYTRQVVDQVSLNLKNAGRYAAGANVGYGVQVTGISQVRDPYLDIRFRNEIAKVGDADVKLSIMQELEGVLDEVVKSGMQDQLTDFSSMLQKLSANVDSKEFENMVKSSAESLTKLLNQAAKQLETIRSDQEYDLKQVNIPEVNTILSNISELNASIKSGQINGNPSLELVDQRNTLLDELASYIKIDVKYVPTKLSENVSVDELHVDFVGESGKINLINHTKHGSFEIPEDSLQLNLKDSEGNVTEDIFSELTGGSLKGALDMLTSSGAFDGAGSTTRGIGYYEKMLDVFASKFAKTFNDLNNAGVAAGADKKDLFAATDGGEITAKNICIATGWSTNKYGLTKAVTEDGSAPAAGASDNILKMIAAMTAKQTFTSSGADPDDPADDITLFTGSFHEFHSSLNTTLGIDMKSTKALLENYVTVANEIADSKNSISSVSLDEEGVNLLRYQKSYSAAARLMTTLDEAVDTIINKMGVVGR